MMHGFRASDTRIQTRNETEPTMENSKISWCDHTFNPWEGCTKVSPGCAHCYAETRNARFGGGEAKNWGEGAPRRHTSAENWAKPVRWDEAAKMGKFIEIRNNGEVLARGSIHDFRDHPSLHDANTLVVSVRPRVFCASLADWLDDEVPVEWLANLLDLIRRTPHLDWLLLTKRPQNWRNRLLAAMESVVGNLDLEEWIYRWLGQERTITLVGFYPNPPANVWIGTTVEDQKRADQRIPELLRIPAHVRFLSCEPLLGPVDLRIAIDPGCILPKNFVPGIHWVIAGGESGNKARSMHPDWTRSLRDQCAAASVPFHFKQWGEWFPGCQYREGDRERLHEKAQHTFDSDNHSWLVGKSAAGRLLDGVEHNAFPNDSQPQQETAR